MEQREQCGSYIIAEGGSLLCHWTPPLLHIELLHSGKKKQCKRKQHSALAVAQLTFRPFFRPKPYILDF